MRELFSGLLGKGIRAALISASFILATGQPMAATGSGSVRVAAGGDSSFAIDSGGDLYAWGNNANGELGFGRVLLSKSPIQVGGANYAKITAGDGFALALKTDGTLWAWGKNVFGQLGDGTTSARSVPVKIGAGFSSVATGQTHTLAIKSDGTLWAWGNNEHGQLGDGTTANSLSPKQVGTGFSSIAAGAEYESFATKTDGTLWAWGVNWGGRLGDGTTTERHSPVSIGSGFQKVAHAGMAKTYAIKTDGTLWAWGAGPLGDGTQTTRSSPVQVGSGYTQVASGAGHTMALKSDGSLWAWGYTDAGQFGNGTTAIAVTTLPTQVGTGFAAIAASSFDKYTIAVKTDGTLWSWGINIQSQLGNDGVGDESCGKYSLNGSLIDLVCKKTPIQIGSGFVAVSAGQNISGGVLNVALKSDGTVVAWGANDNGQLGQADVNLLAVPVKVGSGFASVVSEGGETYPHQLRAGHSAAIRQDGTLWTWGKNDRGQLGDGTLTDKSVPSQIASGFSKVGVGQNFSIGLKTDGTLWSWGDNFYGTLGTGELCDSFNGKCTALTPRQTGTGYESVAVGDSHIAALKTDGSVWGWGNNYFGQLGFTTSKECDPSSAGYRCERTPVMILAAGSKVTQLAAGASHTVALKSDGSIWTWGFNQYGQLGDGGTVNRSSPLQVAAPGSGFIQVAAGRSHTIALKQDGSLWGWGDVSQGQIGNKGLTPIAIPTQFSPAGSQFTQIGAGRYHSVAVKQDGTVWASGGNWSGQVGDGTFANAAFPTLVVNTSLTDFLDLDSTAPNSIPSGVKPPFLVKASKSGDLSSLSLSVDMRGQLGVASTRSVAHSSGYNAYVAANSGAGGTVYWFQLDARKQWSGLTLPMAEFMTGVALSTNNDSIILDILDRIDLSSLADLHIYIGYGLDALEMVSTGRFREVMSISTLAQ